MRRWALVVTSCTLLACTGPKPAPMTVCPRARAPFALQINGEGPSLPLSLTVKVGFGGAETERYTLLGGNGSNDVLCCSAQPDVSLRPQSCGQSLSAADAGATHAVGAAA